MPNKPNTNRAPVPVHSTRPARTYTAGCHERTTPSGYLTRRWVLMSQDGQVLISETSEKRLWRQVARLLSGFNNYGTLT